jgi:DNA modification methylase
MNDFSESKDSNINYVSRNLEEMLNKIFNEDCLEVMKRIPDKSIDMILC